MAFSLTTTKQGPLHVLTVQGFIDGPAGRQILDQVKKLSAGTHRTFVVDFSACSLANSTGMGELIEMVSLNLADHTIRFFFCGVSSTLRFAFTEVGLFHFARDCDSLAAALAQAASPNPHDAGSVPLQP